MLDVIPIKGRINARFESTLKNEEVVFVFSVDTHRQSCSIEERPDSSDASQVARFLRSNLVRGPRSS